MKKIAFIMTVMIIFLSISTVAAYDPQTMAGPAPDISVELNENKDNSSANGVHPLELRIEEIRDMDKSNLTEEEREELKKELRDIRDQARQPGVYISFSALLVILILILIFR